jgi:hypothetical protein
VAVPENCRRLPAGDHCRFSLINHPIYPYDLHHNPIPAYFHKLGTSLAIPLHNMKINVVAAFSKVINNLIENPLQQLKAWDFQGENYGSRTLYCHVRG